MSLRYLAAPVVTLCVLIRSDPIHAAPNCDLILPSSGYNNYGCNRTPPIPEAKKTPPVPKVEKTVPIPDAQADTTPYAEHCVTVYRSQEQQRVCYPPRGP